MIGKLLRSIRARGNASQERQAEVMREVDVALQIPTPKSAQTVALAQDTRPNVSNPEIIVTAKRATLDRKAFFDHLRDGPLRHRDGNQVRGTEAILDAMAGEPVAWVAYALATAWHETGAKMLPNVESLNYSVSGLLNTFGRHRISTADAERLGRKPGEKALSQERQRQLANILYGGEWGRTNLGNTGPDDGWLFRGRGLAHDTGRRNYTLSGQAAGVDLISRPDKLLDLDVAVKVLVSGMHSGRYTGHGFIRHLPTIGTATAAQFGQARRIINGMDKAAQIAAHALAFQGALRVAGWR
jgi:putative chitinase